MTPEELRRRTKLFAVNVIRFANTLPSDPVTGVITRQLVKSGTSVAANYRSSCRAKSKPDFISKMAVAEDEADETQFWLELLVESSMVTAATVALLVNEADQLIRIFVASINTARGGARGHNHQ